MSEVDVDVETGVGAGDLWFEEVILEEEQNGMKDE